MVSQVKFDRWQNTLGSQYSNIIQAQFVPFTQITSMTANQTYTTVNGGVLTITSLYPNTKFMVMINCQGYTSGSNGTNIGLNRTIAGNTVRLVGIDGASGDSWAGSSNGAGSNSYNVYRQYLDSPSVIAGTTITYQILLGLWSAGSTSVNYASNYTPTSGITVFEVQA
jgi:hypothetical protein